MRLLFIPVSVIGGIVAGLVGRKIFEYLWNKIDEQDPPDPDRRDVDWRKLALALAMEGAIFRLVRGMFDHGARLAFSRATGSWPGETEQAEA